MSQMITADEWQAEMSRMDALPTARPIPRGWFTVRDESERRGIGYNAAQKRLNERWRIGLLERKEHQNPAGKGSPVFIYRPMKER